MSTVKDDVCKIADNVEMFGGRRAAAVASAVAAAVTAGAAAEQVAYARSPDA